MHINEPPRILIADADTLLGRKLGDFLKDRGFKTRVAVDGSGAVSLVQNWKPHFVVYDLMLPDLNALEFLNQREKKQIEVPKETAIMVVSNHAAPGNVNIALHAGATDFLIKPVAYEDILARLAFHMQKRKKTVEVSADTDKRGDYYLYLAEMILRKSLSGERATVDLLYDLLNMEALAIQAVRCSLIQTHREEMTGTVLRSSDDRDFSGFGIQLQKYPEVTSVLQSEKLVAIEDLSGNDIMAEVKKDFKKISFNSMVVCPVWVRDEIFGVISARRKEDAPDLSDADIRFCQIIAHTCGLLLQADNPYIYAAAA